MCVEKLTVTELEKDRHSVYVVRLVNTSLTTTSYRILSPADFSKTVPTLHVPASTSAPRNFVYAIPTKNVPVIIQKTLHVPPISS